MKMRLHPEPFERVKSGEKNVECRLNDEKRQQLSVGDTIVFQNRRTMRP
jgi:ASC-1-like (ASCH) protein